MVEASLFVIASASFLWLSRASLRDPRSHGFPRFFAWEAILALVLLNLRGWFSHPLSIYQIISWILLLLSGFLVIQGIYHLHAAGHPSKNREDSRLIGIEKTTALVTVGAYTYIRHPLYASLLFLAWGAFFKDPSWPGIGLWLVATVFLTLTAKFEEVECLQYFGPKYQIYMEHTKMFIPFVF